MIVRQRFDGRDHPFEGERRLTLGTVPAGAKLVHARAVVSPVVGADGAPPVETLAFAGEAWGATRVRRPAETLPVARPGWVEVDFHARRTLHSLAGSGLSGATVEIDLGGAFAEVKRNGTLLTPADPDVEALTLAADDELLPGLTVGRFRISSGTASPDLTAVRVRGVPRNVSLALGAEPAFFTAPGELSRAVTVEDFTAVLAAFLAGDEPEAGFHRVPLVLRSDALGRLDVEVEIELLQQQSLLPADLDEVVVPYAYSAMPEAAHGMLEVALPPGMRVRATEGSVVGAFEESRIVLDAGAVPPEPPSVPLAADRAQAQRLVLAERLEATAADLLLAAVSRRARLELDLLADLDGKPGGDSLLPRPAAFTLDRETAGAPTWVSVPLGVAAQLGGPERRSSWLAVKVLEGEALWFVGDAGPEAAGRLQNTTDGALSWRRSEAGGLSSPAALFRLRHVPETFEMPIELQVGSGEAARRVSFAAQAASGRVDFDLDLPAIAEAFNEVHAARGAGCLEGEHLDNPDFERWFALGDALGPPVSVSLEPSSAAGPVMAASPDGRRGYVVTALRGSSVRLQTVDLVCSRLAGGVDLGFDPDRGFDSPTSLAIDPAGLRAYLAAGHGLFAFDFSEPGLLGSGALPVHTLNGAALAVALSGDGSRLFVLEAGDPRGEGPPRLHTFDAHSLVPGADFFELAADTVALAASADGRLLASLGAGGRLRLHDPTTLRAFAEISVPQGAHRVALEPGGRRAFVATSDEATDKVTVVDLELRRPVGSLTRLRTTISDLAVTPDGNHLLLAGPGLGEPPRGTLSIIPIGSPLPEEWAVTGPVRLLCPEGLGPVVVLGSDPEVPEIADGPFGLSQVATVAPGCRYDLAFDGAATVEDARVEVSWITEGCRPAETVSVSVPRLSRGARALPRTTRRLTAPPEARQAEVRLRLPDGLAVMARLSLAATADALENGLLRPGPGGPPAGWELEPPGAAGFSVSAVPEGGVRLVSGLSTVVLTQTVGVQPGQLFELVASGGRGTRVTTGASAELAVSWVSAAGTPVGAPVALALGQTGTAPAQASGRVPDGATLARLDLRLPAGASVAVERLAFALREPQVTPAVFLAQAPGELRIRDWKVAYEPAEPARPPVPPAGLCTPTPPGLEAGDGREDDSSCPHCKKRFPMEGAKARTTAGGRTVAVGPCPGCGEQRARFIGRPPSGAEPFAPRRLPAVLRPQAAPGAAPTAVSARLLGASGRTPAKAAEPPLTAIVGIAEGRERELRELGIDSVRKLAQADPDLLDRRLTGAARPLAEDLIAQARRLTR